MSAIPRRHLLLQVVAATVAACSSPASTKSALPCATQGAGAFAGYCLLENTKVRVAGAARLRVNEVVLAALDDNTAVVVARDAAGLYAMSAICTHACCAVVICGGSKCSTPQVGEQGCAPPSPAALALTGAAFVCPCHGSTFDASGDVLGGPAQRRLPSFEARIDGDDVVVDCSKVVASTTRLSVA